MKECTRNLFAEVYRSLLKSGIAFLLVFIAMLYPVAALGAMVILAFVAAYNGKNPLYLGVGKEEVKRSKIIKFGMPLVLMLFCFISYWVLFVKAV